MGDFSGIIHFLIFLFIQWSIYQNLKAKRRPRSLPRVDALPLFGQSRTQRDRKHYCHYQRLQWNNTLSKIYTMVYLPEFKGKSRLPNKDLTESSPIREALPRVNPLSPFGLSTGFEPVRCGISHCTTAPPS